METSLSLLAGTAMFLVLLAIAAVLTRQQKREWERQLHDPK
jgi:ABC-type nickel/cobalt efflux system permease component RcnA